MWDQEEGLRAPVSAGTSKARKTDVFRATGAHEEELRLRHALDEHRWWWIENPDNPDSTSITIYRMVSGIKDSELWASLNRMALEKTGKGWYATRLGDLMPQA